jgi:hypothetical protein
LGILIEHTLETIPITVSRHVHDVASAIHGVGLIKDALAPLCYICVQQCLGSDPPAHNKGQFPSHAFNLQVELIGHVDILGDDVQDNASPALIDAAHQHTNRPMFELATPQLLEFVQNENRGREGDTVLDSIHSNMLARSEVVSRG